MKQISVLLFCLILSLVANAQSMDDIKSISENFDNKYKENFINNDEVKDAAKNLEEALEKIKKIKDNFYGNKKNHADIIEANIVKKFVYNNNLDNNYNLKYAQMVINLLKDKTYSNTRYEENGQEFYYNNFEQLNINILISMYENLTYNQIKNNVDDNTIINSLEIGLSYNNEGRNNTKMYMYNRLADLYGKVNLENKIPQLTLNMLTDYNKMTKEKQNEIDTTLRPGEFIFTTSWLPGYFNTYVKDNIKNMTPEQAHALANAYYNTIKNRDEPTKFLSLTEQMNSQEILNSFYNPNGKLVNSLKTDYGFLQEYSTCLQAFKSIYTSYEPNSYVIDYKKDDSIYKVHEQVIQKAIANLQLPSAASCATIEDYSNFAEKYNATAKETEWNEAAKKCFEKEKKAEEKRARDKKRSDRRYERRNKGFTFYVGWHPQNYFWKDDSAHPKAEISGHILLNSKKVMHDIGYTQINDRRSYFLNLQNKDAKYEGVSVGPSNGYRLHYLLRFKNDGFRRGSGSSAVLGLGYTNRAINGYTTSFFSTTSNVTNKTVNIQQNQYEFLVGSAITAINKLGIDFMVIAGPTYNMTTITTLPEFGNKTYTFVDPLMNHLNHQNNYISFTYKLKLSVGLGL
jgi:hypothetical protein